MIYELFALALVNKSGTHFIARYFDSDGYTVCTYDGMKNKGVPLVEPSIPGENCMFGPSIKLPKDYTVYQVFYFLCGGLDSQQEFYRTRLDVLSRKFNLQITPDTLDKLPTVSYMDDKLKEMEDKDRFWISNTERSRRTFKEYISKDQPSAPPAQDHIEPESEEETEPPVRTATSRKKFQHTNLDLAVQSASRTPQKSHPPIVSGSHSNPQSPAKSLSSLPDSEFDLNCRCGLQGNGNLMYNSEAGRAIQCEDCKSWSHMACQKNGRASHLKVTDPFQCDFCDPSSLLPMKDTVRRSLRRQMTSRARLNKPLRERLCVGRGALSRVNEFWYPVRVLNYNEQADNWNVMWWRGCTFPKGSKIKPGTITSVHEDDLVDSLWGDRTGRRKIRLGRWKHACEAETVEDILANPSSRPYPYEMGRAMAMFTPLLKQLLTDPHGAKATEVPAKRWLEDEKKDVKRGIVPFVGTLTILERAQLANWFEREVMDGDVTRRHEWTALLTIAHAHTLYIARRRSRSLDPLTQQQIEEAWTSQKDEISNPWCDVDVDRECLETFEEQLFERSSFAGVAGHYQWGLDSGDHQDGWNPYMGLPEHWNHGDREGSDEECQVGPHFIALKRPRSQSVDRSRPKARPVPKKKRRLA
ncbi:hypothetical protein D9613_009694 [Agrocybe pediades]|uniref:Zinc finger PHD-type domain-containing protein n=1 Tax=Agrocybe pediades TaxID=84607 RepID=A0A8H4QWR1_9AGAR|nr:hypothetical protein D9613_009694 [Agrocybe pediades]